MCRSSSHLIVKLQPLVALLGRIVNKGRVDASVLLPPSDSGALLTRIEKLRVKTVKSNNNADSNGKGEVLGLYLAY